MRKSIHHKGEINEFRAETEKALKLKWLDKKLKIINKNKNPVGWRGFFFLLVMMPCIQLVLSADFQFLGLGKTF